MTKSTHIIEGKKLRFSEDVKKKSVRHKFSATFKGLQATVTLEFEPGKQPPLSDYRLETVMLRLREFAGKLSGK